MHRTLAVIGLVGLFALSFGCATYVPLPTLSADINATTLDADEQYLWKKSREIQHEVETSGLLFEDPELDAYLAQVLQRVTAEELIAAGVEPRVQVISDVKIHGYSFANGVIYLHTALLARMQDETQLATVLSRELAHVINRHALRARRDERIRADTMAWVGVGAQLAGEYGSSAKLLAQAFAISSAVGFPHALETQADAKGLATLQAAGYDVRETPAFFQSTLDYLAEIHGQGPMAWAAFAPPPAMSARIAGYKALIAQSYADAAATGRPIAEAPTFRRKLHKATRRQAELELSAGLFYSAEKTARLATESDPRDAEAWVLLGRALDGQRSKPIAGKTPSSIKTVRAAFGEAIEIDPLHPAAIRELGLTYYRTTSRKRSPAASREALRLFERYLRAAPRAGDADYIRNYIRELAVEAR